MTMKIRDSKPKIAVVVPCFNLENYIGSCLESLKNQTEAPDEIVVVDNGSQDRSLEIVRSFGYRVVVETQKGASACRNRGIAETDSEWICLLDGDDLFHREKIAEIRKYIQEHPEIEWIAHNEFEGTLGGPYHEKLLDQYYDPKASLHSQLFDRCFLSTSTISISRKLIEQAQGFNVKYTLSQDYELWMRLSQLGQLGFIKKTLGTYILRADSISSNFLARYYFAISIIDLHSKNYGFHKIAKRKLRLFVDSSIQLARKGRFLDLVRFSVKELFWKLWTRRGPP